MKCYIFLTFDIRWVGGGQCYVASKAQYLESQGWDVRIFSSGYPNSKEKCPIDYLNKYLRYITPSFVAPPHMLPRFWVKTIINQVKKEIVKNSSYDEIIIESHNDVLAFWGELLASKMSARHVFWTANEKFRLPNQFYEDKISFFLFKFERKEVWGSCYTVNRLLEGYKKVEKNEFETIWIDEEPVQDCNNLAVEKIAQYDWNIGYIGRSNKSYVPNIIRDVGLFCSQYTNKQIQFIIVGDIGTHKNLLTDIKNKNKNLIVTELGNLHPIPRALFKKIDVVIAGSGSARCSMYENVLTIVADTETTMSNGILGYDAYHSIYKGPNGKTYSFKESLERALVDKTYLQMEYCFPPKRGVAECTKQNFELISKASKKQEYFDEEEICKGKIRLKTSIHVIIASILNRFGF